MKEYKIYYNGTENTSLNFMKFAQNTETYINADKDIMDQCKEANKKLYQAMKDALEETEDIYAGYVFQQIMDHAERYIYLKHLIFNDREFEAEIDIVKREFSLIEV